MTDWFTLTWKVLVVRGVVGVVLGVVVMAWPGETAAAFVILWGIWALVDGIGSLAEGFSSGPRGPRWLHLLMGAVSLVVAVLAITSPAMTAKALTWLVGIWLVVRGLSELIGAVTGAGGRAFLVGSGLVDLLLGVLFVANPGKSVVGIAWLLGLIVVLWGIVFLVVGLVVRSQAHHLADESPDPGPITAPR